MFFLELYSELITAKALKTEICITKKNNEKINGIIAEVMDKYLIIIDGVKFDLIYYDEIASLKTKDKKESAQCTNKV